MIGIEINENFKAYPFVELFQQKSPLEDVLGGKQIILEFNLETRNGVIREMSCRALMLSGSPGMLFILKHKSSATVIKACTAERLTIVCLR